MSLPPNLFSYATSELSQDAFICWLLSWASPDYKDIDAELHNCSKKLINAFFEKFDDKEAPADIQSIEVKKQDKNIDVLCIVNGEYPIIIEDKTKTKEHSNQLARYHDNIKKGNFDESNILCIYFKTGDQGDRYEDVLRDGYQPFLRKDILSVLNTYKGANSILTDYRSHIQSLTDKVESYKTKKISEWDECAWIGFYLELQGFFSDGEWEHVNSPTNSFWGFWWNFQGKDSCEQYLQLEEFKFCFKIEVNTKDTTTDADALAILRNTWSEMIIDKGSQFALDLKKPDSFGSGKTMTVCVFNGEYRVSDNEIVDMEKTIERLKQAEKLLKSLHATV